MSYTGTCRRSGCRGAGRPSTTASRASRARRTGAGRPITPGTQRGDLIGQRAPVGRYYYLFDGLGSVAALTDSAGNVANRYAYDPYGQVTSSSGTVANPWRFGGAYGAYTDAATGLVKIGQRYYDPGVGRWTQPDPKVLPFDPVQGNRYSYAGCSPTNFTDPSGLKHQCDWVDVVDATVTLGLSGVALYAGAMKAATTPYGVPLLVAGTIGAIWRVTKLGVTIDRCMEH